jgi:hypothetical protein
MKPIFYFILLAAIQMFTFGHDLKLVGKVKFPFDIYEDYQNTDSLYINQIDEDGKMDILFGNINSQLNFIMDKNGFSIFPKIPEEIIELEKNLTNIIGTIVENNVLKVIQSESKINHYYKLDRSVLFKTFSTNGYVMVINDSSTIVSNVVKISANSNEILSQSRKLNYQHLILDFNNQNIITKKTIFNGSFVFQGNFNQYNPKSKYNVSAEIKDGYIYVYYITSTTSPYFLNSTKLSINTVGANSVSGTIETQTTNSISIQSSDNISDWKTIQTIQNPSGKQFVVPVNKPKEFIRAIE